MEIGKAWDDNPWVWVVEFSRIPRPLKGKKERPILFSTTMVEALLEGRKTQTRRVMKPQPSEHWMENVFRHQPDGNQYKDGKQLFWIPDGKYGENKCPYGRPGDVLWVRETWAHTPSKSRIIYKAASGGIDREYAAVRGWKPSIHMPKAAARIWLLVENVRVERLHEISSKDALAEGIHSTESGFGYTIYRNYLGTYKDFISSCEYNYNGHAQSGPVASFCTLWKSING